MAIGPDFIRELRAGEEPAVDTLLRAAFNGAAEAQLVQDLRKSRAIAGEMVMAMEGQVIGYFALSYMTAPKGWLCLAPVAIHPDMQGRRYGSRMIGFLGEWGRMSGARIVVLGKVGFYERAGFSNARAAGLVSGYGTSEMLLLAQGNDVPHATLIYPKPFAKLGYSV